MCCNFANVNALDDRSVDVKVYRDVSLLILTIVTKVDTGQSLGFLNVFQNCLSESY